ncbi:MAG: helix-turn-helix domain-containing protein [Candidatus Uhrbacteria bacterium]|nr:helix-turn-helix domain-containing protein [Candidatus Uhrbacteria bacterium]
MRKLDRVPQTLGEKLRALRRGQAVSMDMMERSTHIQRRYLEAMEKGRFDKLPAPLYTRNFIRAYARELKADEHYFLELYDEECGRCDLVEPMRMPRQRVGKWRFFVWNRLVKFGIFASLAFLVIGYLGWQIQSIVSPPDVVLFSPLDSSIASDAILRVDGMVDGEATVYVNGEQVVVSNDMTFSTEVDLEKGLNTIVVEAERRYSRRSIEERRVVFDPQGVPKVSLAEE